MVKRLTSPDIRLYVGKGGSGKSTLARHHLKAHKRVLIHDPNGEPENERGAFVVETKRDLIDHLRAAGSKPVRLCYRPYGVLPPPGTDPRAYKVDLFEWANEAAWHAGNIAVMWDEMDGFTFAGGMPTFADMLIQQGRHRAVRVYGCARSVYRVPRDFSRNARRCLIFRTTESRDLTYWRETIGDAHAQLPGLPDYHYLDWTETTAKVCKPIKL